MNSQLLSRLVGLALRQFGALLILLLAAPAFPGGLARGVVVDAAGKPAVGAQVGSSFTLADSLAGTRVQISYSDPAVICDAAGSFSMPAAPISYTHVLVAKGRDGTLGYAMREDAVPTRIVLLPAAHLVVQVSKPFGQQHPWIGHLVAKGSTVGYVPVTAQPTDLLAPQGSLELSVSDEESIMASRQMVLSAARPTALHFTLQPVWWVRNTGKPAPTLSPTDLQNWPAGRAFTMPKGKWVLVSFWATWCRPCVAEMSKLIDFYQQHAALRDRFEILAVHSPEGGASFAAIQGPYQHLVKVWGHPVPFPLLFDATGETHRRWGVAAYPTTLLIDPAGKLAGPGNLEILAAKLHIGQAQTAEVSGK
jgi:thiol-disulfide isomerase/thioredoxin